MIDSRTLAQTAYFALVRKVADAQQTVITHKALVAEFGEKAISPLSLLHSTGTIRNGPEQIARIIERSLATIAETLPVIEKMEAVLKENSDAAMEAFLRDVVSRMRT